MKTSPIREQINQIWCTLRTPETGDTFLQTLSALWKLLSRSVLLLFLLALLVLATAVWLWGTAFQKGREYREWLNREPTPDSDDFLAKLGKDLQGFFGGLSEFAGSLSLKLLGVQESNPIPSGSQARTLPSGGTPVAPSLRQVSPSTQNVK